MIGLMDLKGYGRKWSWPNKRYCLVIFPEGLRENAKILSYEVGLKAVF
jgi:hypothetical protein